MTNPTRPVIPPIWTAVAAAACWGLGTTLSKLSLSCVAPIPLLIAQLAVALALLAPVTALMNKQAIGLCPFAAASLTGILEPGLAYALTLGGLRTVPAGKAALIGGFEPFMIVGLSWLLFGDRVSRSVLLACLLALAGAALIEAPEPAPSITQHLASAWRGEAMIWAGVVCAGFYVASTSRLVKQIPPLPLVLGQTLAALLFAILLLVATGPARFSFAPFSGISLKVWSLIALSGAVQYGLTFWLFASSLEGLSPAVAGLALSLIPVFGVLAATLLLGEQIMPMQLAGAALVLVAIFATGGLRVEPAADGVRS